MTSIEIRNSIGMVVYTTNHRELAFRFIAARKGDLGPLTAWTVTHTVTEQQLFSAAVTPIRTRSARHA